MFKLLVIVFFGSILVASCTSVEDEVHLFVGTWCQTQWVGGRIEGVASGTLYLCENDPKKFGVDEECAMDFGTVVDVTSTPRHLDYYYGNSLGQRCIYEFRDDVLVIACGTEASQGGSPGERPVFFAKESNPEYNEMIKGDCSDSPREALVQFLDTANPAVDRMVKMNVGGVPLTISLAHVREYPNSRMLQLFGQKWNLRGDQSSHVLIDRDPVVFGHLLNWMRAKQMCPDNLFVQCMVEADYWAIDDFIPAVLHLRPDLSRSYMPGVNFEGMDLSNYELDKSVLSGCSFSGANLQQVRMKYSYLIEADMTNAVLDYAKLDSSIMTHAKMDGAHLVKANLGGSNLSGASLRNANLSSATLTRAVLSGVDLSGADLTGASLSDANYENAIFENAIFVDVTTHRSRGDQAHVNLARSNLSGANLRNVQLPQTNCYDVNFAKADLTGVNMMDSVLLGANFEGAQMEGADLSSGTCDMKWEKYGPTDSGSVCFKDANLANANLANAKFRKADFRGANLKGADLRGADLTAADLRGADVTGTNFDSTNLNSVIMGNFEKTDFLGQPRFDE